jgi:hypothetical protein
MLRPTRRLPGRRIRRQNRHPLVPELDEMVKGGLITVEDVKVRRQLS